MHTHTHTHIHTHTHLTTGVESKQPEASFLSFRGWTLHPTWAHRCLPHSCLLGNVRPRGQNGSGSPPSPPHPPVPLCGFLTFNSHGTNHCDCAKVRILFFLLFLSHLRIHVASPTLVTFAINYIHEIYRRLVKGLSQLLSCRHVTLIPVQHVSVTYWLDYMSLRKSMLCWCQMFSSVVE